MLKLHSPIAAHTRYVSGVIACHFAASTSTHAPKAAHPYVRVSSAGETCYTPGVLPLSVFSRRSSTSLVIAMASFSSPAGQGAVRLLDMLDEGLVQAFTGGSDRGNVVIDLLEVDLGKTRHLHS
ncbi:hypothetical protein NRF20_42310 [Streptomyces sp. R-74717]|uniref:hypothetical protein n=1 Tax=Streptomyces TaxID=1883 RepID=UPI0037BA58AF